MAINAAFVGGTFDGSPVLIDASVLVSEGDLLRYDSATKSFRPASFSDLDIISLVDVNSAIDAHALATASNGGVIDLLSYATHVEVAALFDAYIPDIDYASVTNTPSLLSYATSVYVDQQIAAVNLFSGNYADLIDAPTIFSGSYADLIDQPIFPNVEDLASIAYVDQQIAAVIQPSLSSYATSVYVDQQIAAANSFSGNYADLIDAPTIFSGSYADLIDQPIIPSLEELASIAYVDGQIASAVSPPAIDLSAYATSVYVNQQIAAANSFSGNYADLIDAPTIFSGSYTDLVDQPILPNVEELASIVYVDEQIAAVIQPSLSSYATSAYVDQQISAVNLFSGNFADLIDIPTIFSGSYADLVDQPIIPNISGLASITYVDAQIADVILPNTDLSGYALSTYVDQQIATEIATEIAALTLFSGSFGDLINTPTIFSGNYADLVDQPIIPDISDLSTVNYVDQQITTTFSGNFTDLVGVPSFSTINYVDQQLANAINGSPIDLSSYATEAELAAAIAEPDITGDKNFIDNVEFRADIQQVASSATTTARKRNLVFAIETTDALETEVSFSDNTYITLSDNTTAKFTATYVATTGVVHDSFTVSGIVHKMDGVLVAIGNNSYEVTQDSISGVTGAVSVDVVNDRMKVTVTGISDWVVFVDLTEVTR